MGNLIAVAVVDLKAGAALDWAVAKALGKEVSFSLGFCNPFSDDGEHTKLSCFSCTDGGKQRLYEPSTNWAHGGQLIDTHGGDIIKFGRVGAPLIDGKTHLARAGDGASRYSATGLTALEAFCKALVGSKFGDAVTVPRELVEVQS